MPGSFQPILSLTIPLEALADFPGRGDGPVVIESPAPDRTVVHWDDRGIPQSREYLVIPPEQLEEPPAPPETFVSTAPGLLDALAEASCTATGNSPRYALDCLQLRGTIHEVVATDGHQLLVRSGFAFPWDGDLLIKGSPILGARGLPRDQPVRIGRTETHVVLQVGPWTLWHEIQKDGHFPRVEESIPDADAVKTQLRLDPDDARFLGTALGRLPGGDQLHGPVTVDLNGKVAVRARAGDQGQITELLLTRSSCTGPPIQLNTNRAFLVRALHLGFNDIGIVRVEAAVVCRQPHQVYAWQPLSADSAIGPTSNVIRIESGHVDCGVARESTTPETARSPMTKPMRRNGQEPKAAGRTTVQPGGENAGTSLTALVQDAEALHATLRDARSLGARLISGLRRHRRQSRQLSETLRSLRELKLAEVAE
jgi:hypothetical protein